MTTTTPLPPKDATEIFVVGFDFASELAGSTINTATMAVLLHEGTDPDPGVMLVGALSIVGSTVLQLVQGGITGNTYRLRCVATLANGQRRALAAALQIREA